MLGIVLGLWAALGCASAGAREGGEEGTLAPGSRAEPEPKRERKPLSEKVAGRAAEGAIDEALETLDRPENRERLSRILASEPMQAAAREITAQVVAGVFDGTDIARAKGQLPKLPSNIGRQIGRSLDRDVSPAVGRLVHGTVDAALDAALADENTAKMEAIVQRIGASVTAALARSLKDEVGPALAITIERDILPAVGRGLQSPDMQEAIVMSIASLGIGAARGTQAGLAEANVSTGRAPSVGGTLAVGVVVAIVVAVAFGLLFVVMTVLLVLSNRRQREMVEQSRKREERFLAVLEGRVDTHHEPITNPGQIP